MAGMAFVNPHWGYMSQGAFCTLPIRPFWYRLALAWIPRYLIAIIILGLAVAIYTHVGFAFHSFSQIGQSIKPSFSTTTPTLSVYDVEEGRAAGSEPFDTAEQHSQTTPGRRASSIVYEAFPSQRRASAVTFALDKEDSHHPHERGRRSQSVPTTLRNSIVPIHDVLSDVPVFASQTLESTTKPSSIPYQEPSPSNSRNPSPLSNCPVSHVQRQLAQERARVHKQLRLMFIYPLTYILMWIIPFVSHCMQYQDKWAAHPVYWLTMMSTICITLMGTVDCLVFSLRERPWRHITSSDGTFWGSFACWGRKEVRCAPVRARESDARLSRSFAGAWNASRSIHPGGEWDSGAKRQMCMRMGRTEESFMGSVSVAAHSVRTVRSEQMRIAERDGARQRLEGEREDRRVEKARREMEVQEGERWEEVSLQEGWAERSERREESV
jgi:G protein-coupled receptor GPR1